MASSRTSRAPRRTRATTGASAARSARSRTLSSAARVVLLDRVGDEQPEQREERRDDRLAEDPHDIRAVQRGPQVAQERDLVGVLRDVLEEERVEDHDDAQQDEPGLHDAEHAADDLVDEAGLLEQRLRPIEALDDDRESERRREEHGPEPDHVRIFLGQLRPVVAQEHAERVGDIRGEQEREEDRSDADQASDGALGEAKDEERQEEDDDQPIDGLDTGEVPEIHRTSLGDGAPGKPPEPRKTSSGFSAVATGPRRRRDGTFGSGPKATLD